MLPDTIPHITEPRAKASKHLTSGLDLPDAHVYNHWSLGDVSFHECCQVAAVHLLHVLQVWLTVIGDHLGTLLVNIQSKISERMKEKVMIIISLGILECLFQQKCSSSEERNSSSLLLEKFD